MTTQRFVVVAVMISIVIGAKLSLKTMETQAQQPRRMITSLVPTLHKLSNKKVLTEEVPVEELLKLQAFSSGNELKEIGDQSLFIKLTSQKALKEFREKNTIDGKTLDLIVDNFWALENLKPSFGYVWDKEPVQIVKEYAWPHKDRSYPRMIRMSPDATWSASFSEKDVYVYYGQNRKEFSERLQHQSNVLWMDISPDSSQIVTISGNYLVRVWTKQPDNSWLSENLQEDANGFSFVFLSPDGSQIVTVLRDGLLLVWTRQSDKSWLSVELGRYSVDRLQRIPVIFSPDGFHIAAPLNDEVVRVWTKQEDNSWVSVDLKGKAYSRIRSVVFSPNGSQIGIASMETYPVVWTRLPDNSWSPKYLKKTEEELEGLYNKIIFSKNGFQIIVGEINDGPVSIWTKTDLVGDNNVAAKVMLLKLLDQHGGNVLNNRSHLQIIFNTFDFEARTYLMGKYSISRTLLDKIFDLWGFAKSFVKK